MKCETCGNDSALANKCLYCGRSYCSIHQGAIAHDCPSAPPSELARLGCLWDVEFARNYQVLSLVFIVLGIVVIYILTKSELHAEGIWFWGLSISFVVGGLIGLCFYTYRVNVRMAELKGMVVECPKCGKQIRGHYKSCAFCGYRLSSPPSLDIIPHGD